MKSEEFLEDFLMHYNPGYDPAKAREYYLRTRKLKGRAKGEAAQPKGRTSSARSAGGLSPAQRAAAKSKETKARVAGIRKSLDKLSNHLDKLLEERRKKGNTSSDSSKKESAKDTSKEKSSDKEPAEKLSAAEKAKKAKKARDEYEKKPKEPSEKTAEELDAEIAKVRARLRSLRASLREALDRARD